MGKAEKTATAITLLILLSNIVGYVREMLLANYFGASYVIDAFLMAQSIAFILFTGIISATATSFIPLYSSIKETDGIKAGSQFTSSVINLVALFSIILTLLGIIFADPVVSVIAYGFSEKTHQLTVHFVRIAFIASSVFSVTEIIKAYLHSNDGFTVEKIAGFTINAANILFIVLSAFYRDDWLMYGYLCGYSANLILCLYFAGTRGLRYKLTLPDKPLIKEILVLVLPVFIGSMAGQINNLVDKFLASGLGEGSVSILGYAGTIKNMLMTLATAALLLMIYPYLSNHIAKNNMDEFKRTLSRGMNLLIIGLIPITFGTIALAAPGVSILYERGLFGAAEVYKTSGVLALFSIGMAAMGFNSIASKAFYSVKDSKTPMKIGFLTIILNILFSLLLIKSMTYYGLALSASLASLFAVIPSALLLKKRIEIDYRDTLIILAKSLLAAILMSIAANRFYYFLYSIVSHGFIVKLIILCTAVFTGAVIYITVLCLLQVSEILDYVKDIRRMIMNAIGWGS